MKLWWTCWSRKERCKPFLCVCRDPGSYSFPLIISLHCLLYLDKENARGTIGSVLGYFLKLKLSSVFFQGTLLHSANSAVGTFLCIFFTAKLFFNSFSSMSINASFAFSFKTFDIFSHFITCSWARNACFDCLVQSRTGNFFCILWCHLGNFSQLKQCFYVSFKDNPQA